MGWCNMVRGPCKGNKCDFWARAKLKKMTVEDIVQRIQDSVAECDSSNGKELEDAIEDFWTAFGIKDMDVLREEDMSLFSKIQEAEEQVRA
ncbi:MAG: hypothetical protein BAJATHORv1_110032 [Candidatus Thorarchaeota archaeon]|nr:MAG: hypothetical protein BAJATHORv1_110032 [Candidatus Thorarchaeota archaeon]